MDNSYLNIIFFLLTTFVYYYYMKPTLTIKLVTDKHYISDSYMYLAIYFLLIVIIQFGLNTTIISTTCGGNISENIGAAGVFTFIPWTFIFGLLIIILKVYPGFKTAFSDVIGYYWISDSANKILTKLLINTDIQKKITSDTQSTSEQKAAMQNAADAIIKICGNTSILVNQIFPANFESYWGILNPLKKQIYQTSDDGAETQDGLELKNALFDIVVTKDNVGECMWYIYTGLLVTALVQLKMMTRGCISNPKTMEQNYQKFLDDEEKAKQQRDLATSTEYTIT